MRGRSPGGDSVATTVRRSAVLPPAVKDLRPLRGGCAIPDGRHQAGRAITGRSDGITTERPRVGGEPKHRALTTRRGHHHDVAGGAFRIDEVDVAGEWCRLVLFAVDRSSFVARANTLDLRLPRGWRKTRPEPLIDHTCGHDELVHLSPIEDTPRSYAGSLAGLTAMLAAAQEDPKRGPTWWRIQQAAVGAKGIVPCEVDHT